MYKILQILIFTALIIFKAYAQPKIDEIDTLSLNDKINREVQIELLSLPPLISASLYCDGKKISKGYQLFLLVNDVIKKRSTNTRIKLDTARFLCSDSISFLIKYKTIEIYSEKCSYKSLVHGGHFTAGYISDYDKMREEFVSDNTSFFYDAQQNSLYNVLLLTTKRDKDYVNKKSKLNYGKLTTNLNGAISYKFKFY